MKGSSSKILVLLLNENVRTLQNVFTTQLPLLTLLSPLHQQRHFDHIGSTDNLNPHDLSHFVTESLGLARAPICILCGVQIIQVEKMLGYSSSVRLRATQCNYDIF